MRSTWGLYIVNNPSNHAQTFGDNHHHQPRLRDPLSNLAVSLDAFFLWLSCVSSAVLPLDVARHAPLGGVPRFLGGSKEEGFV